MGPRSGTYSELNDEDDEDVDLRSGGTQNGQFVALGERNVGDPEADESDFTSPDRYWAKLRGLERMLGAVVRFICRRHIYMLVLVLTVIAAGGSGLFAVLVYPVELETSLSSFQIPNHKVYEREDALDVALGHRPSAVNTELPNNRQRRGASPPDGYLDKGERRRDKWKINLIFMAKDGGNIFRKDVIETIHGIEKRVEEKKNYTAFCWLKQINPDQMQFPPVFPPDISYCNPINSLLTYFYRWEGRTDQMAYDGNVTKALENAKYLAGSNFYWFVDSSQSSPGFSRLLRSQIILGSPLHHWWIYGTKRSSVEHKLAKDYIISFVPYLERLSNSKVRVLYGSPDIYDYQVLQAVYSDIKLSAVAVTLIVIFVFILTSFSPFLTFFCIFSVLLSFLPAYFLYRVVAGVTTFGMLNTISFFVVTGIGVDDGFMFINTYRQAPAWVHCDDTIRLHYTLFTAGKATFFTSVTTAGAFFANMASGIPAVHNFGLFMGLVVVMCYLTVLLCMPPALHIWAKHLSGCESSMADYLLCRRKRLQPGTSLELLVMENNAIVEQQDLGANGEMPNGTTQQNHAVENGSVPRSELVPPTDKLHSQSRTSIQSMSEEGCGTVRVLYRFIKHWIMRPVIKGRIVVLILFVILLTVSLALASHLKTADKPPRFFPKDSNLQQFIDVFYNASKQNVDCQHCSAYFNSHKTPANSPTQPATTHTVTTKPTTATGPTQPATTHTVTTKPTTATERKPTITNTMATSPAETTSLTHEPTTARVIVTSAGITSPSHKPTPPRVIITSSLKKSTTGVVTGTKTVLPKDMSTSPLGESTTAVTTELTRVQPTKPTPPVISSKTPSLAPMTQQPKQTTMPPLRTTHRPKVTKRPPKPTAARTIPVVLPTIRPTRPPVRPPTPGAAFDTKPPVEPTVPQRPAVTSTRKSNDVDLCAAKGSCSVSRVSVENSAEIYIVFGIKTIKRNTTVSTHVLNSNTDDSKGVVLYDPKFPEAMVLSNLTVENSVMKALCQICASVIAPWRKLVSQDKGAYECFPSKLAGAAERVCGSTIAAAGSTIHASYVLEGRRVKWLAMAFQSNVYKGGSSFKARDDFDKWEAFVDEVKKNFSNVPAIQSVYQTSEYWKLVFLEVISVISAIYSIVLSALLCIILVAVFTGCPLLTTVTMLTVIGIASLVLCLFYLLGWKLGAVEAISLSILIGTAVDYAVHLVEGYMIAKRHLPEPPPMPAGRWQRIQAHISQSGARASWSLSHVGVSIVSSALTTMFASLPLCFAQIQLLARFGEIMFINTLGSIVLTMTAGCAMLCYQPQWQFPGTWRGSVGGFIGVSIFIGLIALILYIVQTAGGLRIPQPDGSSLF